MSNKPKSLICFRSDKLATVCAWCPDKEAGDNYATNRGYEVSHGVCPECADKMKKEMGKTKESILLFRLNEYDKYQSLKSAGLA